MDVVLRNSMTSRKWPTYLCFKETTSLLRIISFLIREPWPFTSCCKQWDYSFHFSPVNKRNYQLQFTLWNAFDTEKFNSGAQENGVLLTDPFMPPARPLSTHSLASLWIQKRLGARRNKTAEKTEVEQSRNSRWLLVFVLAFSLHSASLLFKFLKWTGILVAGNSDRSIVGGF